MKTLILGGARSGKSRYAQQLAKNSGKQVAYIVTAEAKDKDKEMRRRIEKHQKARPVNWLVNEEPIYLAKKIKTLSLNDRCIVVDCLTLWLSNLLRENKKVFTEQKKEFLNTVNKLSHPIILVSNETGMGIVPQTMLGRLFRDEIGFLHQELGEICDQVIFMIAGFKKILK